MNYLTVTLSHTVIFFIWHFTNDVDFLISKNSNIKFSKTSVSIIKMVSCSMLCPSTSRTLHKQRSRVCSSMLPMSEKSSMLKTYSLFWNTLTFTQLHRILSQGFNYLPTPCGRVLLEKVTHSQLVKKFPALYGTRRFNTAFTHACHLSLSWGLQS
jgi:hypothetical protein